MDNFNLLINSIRNIHNSLYKNAVNSVNISLTFRNWLIGYYIVEYEQEGKDRAQYGAKLLENIALKLKEIRGLDVRSLRNFRRFYKFYPQIGFYLKRGSVTTELMEVVPKRTLAKYDDETLQRGDLILHKLSYTHIEQLLRIDDDLKRAFYEIECIKGTWSVRELKRQINSLYYERSGLSKQPEKLSEINLQKAEHFKTHDFVKNIYAFEFLDMNLKDIVEETDLEKALLDNLHEFILELGTGFCFEARQKRILIGEKYYFIDLVFYHRILKCHVLIDLKIGEFEHGDIGQLNTYLNYFKQNICEKNDNLPVGILLVAEKDTTLVKYATGGMDKNIFVQKYLIKLPSENKLKLYIENELKNLN